VRISINTDDPSLLGTNLVQEYEIARVAYGWTEDILRQVARTSIEASFAPPEIKAKLTGNLNAWRMGSAAAIAGSGIE
jgi:adenosine deaminase